MSGQAAEVGDFQEEFPGLFLAAYHVGYRILGDVTAAEDAAAEAVARALVSWRRVGRLEHRTAWVARTAGNLAIDEVRRARRRRDRPGPALPPATDTTEDAALRVELGAALAALSSRQREVIALRYLADLDEAEVSPVLAISANSVKKHASRGRAALRERLGTPQEVSLLPGLTNPYRRHAARRTSCTPTCSGGRPASGGGAVPACRPGWAAW